MKKINIAYIVDDDKLFTHLFCKQIMLLNLFDTIHVFHDGEEALKHLRPVIDNPVLLPAVILLDINMPVLDGWQFLDEFTKYKLAKKVKVCIVSSSIDQADQIKAASYKEVAHFYVKPITNNQLKEMAALIED